MSNMKLSVKLIGGFVLVALLTLSVGVVGYKGISDIGAALTEVAVVRMPSMEGLDIMLQAQSEIQTVERTILLPEAAPGTREHEAQAGRLEHAWKQVDKGWKIYEPLPQTRDEEALWNKFKPAWEAWKNDHQHVADLVKAGKGEDALALSFGKASKSYYAAEALLEELIELQNTEASSFIKGSIGNVDRPKIMIGIALLGGLVIALLLGLFLSRSITRPIIGVIHSLSEGAEQVASASGQVSSASQSLADGASEQAASLEETSSSLEEMASMTRQNADHAKEADTLMKEATIVVERANESMSQLGASMNEISKASQETSKIVKTIDEIAFQTNLLALNAAVEAARAGEAGAGFAVVADEVRNLALRAAEAAKNTAALIEGTVKKIQDGTELMESTDESFGEVAKSAAKVAGLVAEIAAASGEQAQGIEQVNKAVTEMDRVVQQNAANAEESASASEQMNAQAQQIKDAVSRLALLVAGGAKQRNGGGAPDPARTATPNVHQKRVIPKEKATARPPARTKEVHPEQVIPLDEEEFRDF